MSAPIQRISMAFSTATGMVGTGMVAPVMVVRPQASTWHNPFMVRTHAGAGDDFGELARRCQANYVAFNRALATMAGDRGEVHESNGVVLCASATTFPVLMNQAWRVGPGVSGDDFLEIADNWFADRRRGYSIQVRDGFGEDDDVLAAAEQRGLVGLMDAPEMVCRHRLDESPLPQGIALEWVHDPTTLADFVTVNDAAYQTSGLPAGVVGEAICDLDAFTAQGISSIVAYDAGQPVGAAQVLLSDGIAGVYWVGTVEAARGRGVGEAVTRAVTNRAFDAGAAVVSLQASAMGEPIYARLGYFTLYRYRTLARLGPL